MVVYLHSLNLYNAALFKKKKKKPVIKILSFLGNFGVLTMSCVIQTYICAGNQGKGMHTNYRLRWQTACTESA